MKEEVRQKILQHLTQVEEILRTREAKDIQELETLSNHVVEDVALYKDFDMISISVLIYSLFKVVRCIQPQDYKEFSQKLTQAQNFLKKKNFGPYNRRIKSLFTIIRRCSERVREHLQDIMQAARIKKGTVLLSKGLSIGQAAGLMGLSNWDLQRYAARTTAFEDGHEAIHVGDRFQKALAFFTAQ